LFKNQIAGGIILSKGKKMGGNGKKDKVKKKAFTGDPAWISHGKKGGVIQEEDSKTRNRAQGGGGGGGGGEGKKGPTWEVKQEIQKGGKRPNKGPSLGGKNFIERIPQVTAKTEIVGNNPCK